METGELISVVMVAATFVSVLGAVGACYAFLHRDIKDHRKETYDHRKETHDGFVAVRADGAALAERVARIEGYLFRLEPANPPPTPGQASESVSA